MASYYFTRFSEVGLLKQFHLPLLFQLLQPYRDFFCSKYDIHLTDNPKKFPYQQLIGTLALPDRSMPEPLLSTLFYIDSLSTSAGTRRLATILKHHGRSPDFPLGDESYALYAGLIDTDFLRSGHEELTIDESRETEIFFGRPAEPYLERGRLPALEDGLNDRFDHLAPHDGIQLSYSSQNSRFSFSFGSATYSGVKAKRTGRFQGRYIMFF